MTILSKLGDSFANLVAGLGAAKDKRYYGEFVSRELSVIELEAMYEGDWLSGKVIDIPVEDATRNWRELSAPSIGDRIMEVAAVERSLDVEGAFRDAQKWADLYQGAVILLVVRGDVPVMEPLDPEQIRPGDLLRLEVFDSTEVTPIVRNTSDMTAPYFRRPMAYSFSGGQIVHESRVLTFHGIRLPWRMQARRGYWGTSRLQRFYDALRNNRSTTDSIASMIYEAKLDVISVPELYQEIASPNGLAKIIERFRLADIVKSANNTLLLDDKEKFDRKATQFAGLPEIMQKFMLHVSAAADIPVTRLFGQSAMGLNATGDGDERVYYDRISSDQESRFRPQLAKLDRILTRSAIGEHPPDWDFEFCPLRQITEVERSELGLRNAQRHEIDLRNDIVTPGIVAAEYLARGTYGGITPEYVDALNSAYSNSDSTDNSQ